MAITVYGYLFEADGTTPAVGSVVWENPGLIVTGDGVVLPGRIEAAINQETGYFSQELPTPENGTTLWQYTLPSGETLAANLETGSSVDIQTLMTVEGSAVEPSNLQTLMTLAEQFEDTTVTSGPYTLLETDRYIRASGTWNFTLLAAVQRKVPRIVFNFGTGIITALPTGSDTINGQSSLAIYPNEAWLFVDNAAGRWDAW